MKYHQMQHWSKRWAAAALAGAMVFTSVPAFADGETVETESQVENAKPDDVKPSSEETDTISAVATAQETVQTEPEEMAQAGFSADDAIAYLTLQPGETEESINLNWYIPAQYVNQIDTTRVQVRYGQEGNWMYAEATVQDLTPPTEINEGKYTDTGAMVCEATLYGLEHDKNYTYQIGYVLLDTEETLETTEQEAVLPQTPVEEVPAEEEIVSDETVTEETTPEESNQEETDQEEADQEEADQEEISASEAAEEPSEEESSQSEPSEDESTQEESVQEETVGSLEVSAVTEGDVLQAASQEITLWSKNYQFQTPEEDSFTFAFTSDPQMKEDKSINSGGWNPSDNTNQTGWAKMMEVIDDADATLVVSAGDQVEDQSWGKSSEYSDFFAPEEMTSIAYAPAVGNHDRHYMFEDHFNLPNEMAVAEDGTEGGEAELTQVKTSFRGQNNGTSQSHGNYIQATEDEMDNQSASNGVKPNQEGKYDFTERREMETKGNYYYLYDNVLFVTLNTGAYPGGNDEENAGNAAVPSANAENEAEGIVENFRKTLDAATSEYQGQYQWLIVTHHKSTQTVAKHAADSDVENYVDAGFESLMTEFDVDFVLGGHDHVYSRSYVLKAEDGGAGQRNAERLDQYYDPDGTIYLTGNCASDMQYYTPFDSLDKTNNADYPVLAGVDENGNHLTGSQAYLAGKEAEDKTPYLPIGNLKYNQEYSPSYALFQVDGNTISVKVYNLDGSSEEPDSKLIDTFSVTKNASGGTTQTGFANGSAALNLTEIAHYDAGQTNKDGGVMEIVDYNEQTGWAYAINGQSGLLTAIPLKMLEKSNQIDLLDASNLDVKALVEGKDESFTYGDMTSVAVSPDGTLLAAALQDEDYAKAGRVAFFICNEDGTLTFLKLVTVGVQPDMVTFTPDGKMVLTADEGEPREGYGNDATDPAGTVSAITITNGTPEDTAASIGFTKFDDAEQRKALVDAGIILKKEANPSADLEPEYIAATNDTAYVSLQDANAIAEVDLTTKEVTGIYSAGFEDYSKVPVDIDKADETYAPKTYEGLMGIRMPDGLSLVSLNGKTYLLTANEGDSRDWNGYENEKKVDFGDEEASPSGNLTAENTGLSKKVTFFDPEDYDGLEAEKDYLFGGRSFTIFEVTENGLSEVYDSADAFEAKTAEYLPDYFNCSNDNKEVEDRSGKKGPEPESVTVGTVKGQTYAFVTLERIGGVMVYRITDPTKPVFVNYINTRDFSTKDGLSGDNSPEGLKFIAASESPTGNALLLAACEVGGTVATYELTTRSSHSDDDYEDDNQYQGGGSGSGSSNTQEEETDQEEAIAQETPAEGNEGEAIEGFIDVPDDAWFTPAISYVVEHGLMTGTGSNTFSPNETLTRGMVAQILYQAEGQPAAGEGAFSDVTAGAWYEKAVNWAAEAGLVAGFGDGTFAPEQNITREQLAAILYRYAQEKGYDITQQGDLTRFTDGSQVSDWAEEAVTWAVGAGILHGRTGDTLDAQGTATRAEAAQMVMVFLTVAVPEQTETAQVAVTTEETEEA